MLFNSYEFVVFLPIIFLIYWFVFSKNLYLQNLFVLIASYIFYGWWDWRFLSLIALSSVVDYMVGIGLMAAENILKRKALLWLSIVVNLGILGTFKYYNFFIANVQSAFSFFGHSLNLETLNVILPVGVSFYTFQTMSYTIDIYYGKITPTKNAINFFAFVSFFPQLVAGPIERAKNLLPQFEKARKFDYNEAVDGMRQMLWGFFKKIVIADNCAIYVNDIFSNYSGYNGSTILIGVLFFAFQIYCDFSGYSDIAIGLSRLFGFNIMRNFAYPYFSRDIAEFWRRWHISLSSWFRDYLYIPLGGSRGGTAMKIRNTMIIFVISGFWHGANWTFIAWGFLNALYFVPLMLRKVNRANMDTVAKGHLVPSMRETISMLSTFMLTLIAWVMFRAESIQHALGMYSGMISTTLFKKPEVLPYNIIILIVFLVSVEWLQRDKQHGLEISGAIAPRSIRWAFYYGILVLIFLQGGAQQQFIYFQF